MREHPGSAPSIHLTPGVHAVSRGRDRIQIGLEDRRLILPASARTRRQLEEITHGRASRTGLTSWLDAGVATIGPLPKEPNGRCLAMEFPHDWQARLERRDSTGITVHGALDLDPRPLICAAGLRTGPAPANVALVLSPGPPDPGLLATLTREDTPHLLLRYLQGTATLGPFVQPGVTACGECLESHLTDTDPERPDVIRRYRTALAGSTPPPASPITLSLALAWAVRDLTMYADGEEPTTWSATIRIAPGRAPVMTSWLPHSECGCNWHLPTLES